MPKAILRAMLGELADVFVEGQRVVPDKARKHGFQFVFPTIRAAVGDLVGGANRPVHPAAARAQMSLHYNGDCPVCSAEIDIYKRQAKARNAPMEFCEIGVGPNALAAYGLGPEDAKRRMYVIDRDGRLKGGVDAFVAIWSVLPATGWPARLLGVPGFYHLAAAFYDGVLVPRLAAQNRRREQRSARRANAQSKSAG